MASKLRQLASSAAGSVSRLLDPSEPRIGDAAAARASVPLLVEPGHFYSPIVDPQVARRHLDRLDAAAMPLSLPGLRIDRELVASTWTRMVPAFSTIPFTEHGGPDLRFKFDNDNYSWGDASVLHALLRVHRPRRVIEIGSGWSSACMIDTAERQPDAPCRFTFIEPYPRLLRSLLGETKIETTIIDSPVQQVDLSVFDDLQEGDFLFIDSTHVLKTGSDVVFELFEILPRLEAGVLVHFHDIFWPFEYPRAWAVTENRSWNELYALRAYLMQNAHWDILFFNDYFAKLERRKAEEDYPHFLRNPGGALWLRRSP